MSEIAAPAAARLQRPRWFDPRLVLGVFLILVSVAGGARFFAEVDERVAVWAVTRDLGANTTLTRSDLVARSVRLDETARRYVSAGQSLDGMVLTRAVGRDELLPAAALRERSSVAQRHVVIDVDRHSATGLHRGMVVDVYAVRAARSEEPPARPTRVLAAVTVAEDVKRPGGGLGGGVKAGVALSVPAADVAALIDAMAHGTVYLVQVPPARDIRKTTAEAARG